MDDQLYKMTKKLVKEPPALSFNIQPSINEYKQTSYQNRLSTKRKTTSKRYQLPNQTQMNKTLDFSELRNHKTLSLGKQTQFHPLPQIKIAKNKRGGKKGSFLQTWLNQALDEGQGNLSNQSYNTSLNDQTLGTLKKYGIDRKLLKSKNVTQEMIDKIYKKLFVYSKGLGMTFQEIGRLASLKSPDKHSVGDGNALIEVFWKAFSKIMENETPYQSAFQIVEKNYLKTIELMKERLKKMSEEFDDHIKDYKQEIKKLERELQKQTGKYKKLQNEFQVNKSTLQLAEKSLEEEVELRLKFEEKINSVYTSYNQIKTKYTDIVEEIQSKKELSHQQIQTSNNLREELDKQFAKSQELQHLLSLQKGKVKDLEIQVLIKKEQRVEAQKQILHSQHVSQKQVDEISIQMQRNKHLNSLLNQAKIQKERLKQIYQEEKQIKKKFQQRIEDMTSMNNRIFEEKYAIHNEAQTIKENNASLMKENKLMKQQIQKNSDQLKLLKDEIESLSKELFHQKTIAQDISFQLQSKTLHLNKDTQIIQKLKEVKDRHERLQALAEHDRNQAVKQKISAMSKMQQQELQIQNLKDEIAQKQHKNEINVSKINKAKDLLARKIKDLQQQIDKKDKSLLDHLNTIQQQRILTLKKQREISDLKQVIQVREHQIYKLQSQNVLLASNLPLIEELLQKKDIQLKKQTEKQFQNLLSENHLRSKMFQVEALLEVKKNQVHVEIQAYKKLSQYYKELYQPRKQFIHPMIYQDQLAYSERLHEEIKTLKDKIQCIQQNNQKFNRQYEEMKAECEQLKNKIINLSAENKQLSLSIKERQKQNDRHLTELKQWLNKSIQAAQNEKKLKSQIQFLKSQKQQLLKQAVTYKEQQSKMKDLKNALKQLQKTNTQVNENYERVKTQLQNQKKTNSDRIQKQQQSKKLMAEKQVQTDFRSVNQVKNKVNKNRVLNTIDTKIDSGQKIEILNKPQVTTNSNPNKQLTPRNFNTIKPQASIESNPIEPQAPPKYNFRKLQVPINSNQKKLQVPINSNLIKLQAPESKQITKDLIEHSLAAVEQAKLQTGQIDELENPSQKQKEKMKKKVEKSQFRRALKLTFMRR